MRAQPARSADWLCTYCGTNVSASYTHKCAQFDGAVTIYEGSPLPPMPNPSLIRDIIVNTRWTGGPLNAHDAHWAEVGARHGFLAGWRAGFAVAASGMSASGQDAVERLEAKPASPTGEAGDAQ